MPHYHALGKIPHKRHTLFLRSDGGLYSEQLISAEGFSSESSLVYHYYPPTQVVWVDKPWSVEPDIALDKHLQHRSFNSFNIEPVDDYLESRVPLLLNKDLIISVAAPSRSMEGYFFKNASADEVIFIHKGNGRLKTAFGTISFDYGDHLLIPRGVIYQIEFDTSENRLFIIESFDPVRYPSRYLNRAGQLMENAPFCERDIRQPEHLETIVEEGDFSVMIKKDHMIYPYHYSNHPFDVVGWDGCLYPFAFSVFDFEPITGRVHQPPPVHQTFETKAFVMCAFVPRLYDYHPMAIPAPYNHSNIDSDEVLYYVDGDFMSRKHVEKGQITLHPSGIPHGPHPGAVEKSIGAKETNELAIMVDTFNPLMLTRVALGIEDATYFRSWKE